MATCTNGSSVELGAARVDRDNGWVYVPLRLQSAADDLWLCLVVGDTRVWRRLQRGAQLLEFSVALW